MERLLEPVTSRQSIEEKEKLSKWAKWGWPFMAEGRVYANVGGLALLHEFVYLQVVQQ